MAIPSFLHRVHRRCNDAQAPRQICAIDMGSNTFRRIVGSFENGRYEQKSIERKSLGVGDDVGRHGRISDAKLAEIEETLIGFARSCQNEGVTRVVAIGTAAFRDAPNGATVITLAAKHSISMEIATELRESELAYWLARSVARDTPSSTMAAGVSSSCPARTREATRGLRPGLPDRDETFFAAAENPDAAVQAFATA